MSDSCEIRRTSSEQSLRSSLNYRCTKVFDPSKFASAKLYTRPTQSQLEDKPLRGLHAWHSASYAGGVYSAWRLSAIGMKRPGDAHHPAVVNLHDIVAIMRRSCSDGRA
jgi:hypothetical protein